MIKFLNKIEDINLLQWQSLVKESCCPSYFQTIDCFKFYESLSFLSEFVFGIEENGVLKGVIVGYIQKEQNPFISYLTRRAIIPGGALLHTSISEESLKALLTGCVKCLKKKSIYIEIRNFHSYAGWKNIFAISGFQYHEHLNFQIDTSSFEKMYSHIGPSRKRDIRTSLREGVSTEEQFSEEELYSYYCLLQQLYRTKIKTPLFPFEFFLKLSKLEAGKIFLLKYQDKIIGGSVCVALPKYALYEWFVCGVDGEIKFVYPSTLATYWGMKYASENDLPKFDMMGAGQPDKSYGVRDFKAKFGGTLVEDGRFTHINSNFLYKIGSWGVKYLKRKS